MEAVNDQVITCPGFGVPDIFVGPGTMGLHEIPMLALMQCGSSVDRGIFGCETATPVRERQNEGWSSSI
ncbi:MAG TPA: hypothetical protein VE267_16945, partial [Bradyrhizobium sp.]|nr:hypothetical protein [Bradyrhizobium sp.]